MPQHDPTTPTEADLEILAEYPTRTSRREAVVAGWREQMLAEVHRPHQWALLAAGYVAAMALTLMIPDLRFTLAAIALITAAFWFMLNRMRRHDAHYRGLARLTPVVDRSTLQAEVSALAASRDELVATLGNPRSDTTTRLSAVGRVLLAATPIMARGGVTAETASVTGYPPYPEIDRTEFPGSDGDYTSVHLMRVDASVDRLARAVGSDVILSESIASLAGEVVPPIRSMDAAIRAGTARP